MECRAFYLQLRPPMTPIAAVIGITVVVPCRAAGALSWREMDAGTLIMSHFPPHRCDVEPFGGGGLCCCAKREAAAPITT